MKNIMAGKRAFLKWLEVLMLDESERGGNWWRKTQTEGRGNGGAKLKLTVEEMVDGNMVLATLAYTFMKRVWPF